MNEVFKKCILLFIIFIFFSGASCQVMQSTNDHNCLRILDINVWSGLDYEGYIKMGEYEPDSVREKRYRALVAQIRQLDPDIIGVHEANKLPRYARRLAEDTGYEAFWHVGVGGVRLGRVGLPWNLREGDMILAKPELDPQFVGRKQLSGGYVGKWATFHLSDATQLLAVRITFQDKPVYLFATHWHASWPDTPCMLEKAEALKENGEITEEEYQYILQQIRDGVAWRLSESEKTVAFIRETAEGHDYILMGDFNSESGSQEIGHLVNSGMADLFQHVHPGVPGYTWDPATNLNQQEHYLKASSEETEANAFTAFENFSRGIPRRIDYIFLGPSSGLADERVLVKSGRVVMKEVIDGVQASDHYGIFAEIEIKR
ncbi:MAG: endonuclease/exonuclease/phosphatase family protein [Bacteroidales bacterium]|nr:endonuclease/exonuclease/phosphatase family protein [Bacteroidales bacterium]MBN2698841.1 endonuclease/exonuclease/phosphatase family protein [Bacteroidales bacterium]